MNEIEFKKIKKEFENSYKLIGQIKCPYFNEMISFNAKGLEHLKFMRKNHARSQQEQLMRMRLFPLAPDVVKLSRTVQGITRTKHFEFIRENQNNKMNMVSVEYFEFVAILEERRVRVVIKQIEDGPKFFWSIIPFWKIDRQTGKRRMNYGRPEED